MEGDTTHPERTSEKLLGELEDRLGLRFNDRDLLKLALTHSSFLNENPGLRSASNERLEFLGDAVVGLAIGSRLFREAPDVPEGELTALRSQVVRERALAAAARRLGLGGYLTMGRGAAADGGRDRQSIQADAYEAVVGAIMIDRGYTDAAAFVLRSLEPEFEAALAAESPKDPKSLLQELVSTDGAVPPTYRLHREDEDDEDRRFTVEVVIDGEYVATGVGRRKIDAERMAARRALELMRAGKSAD